MENKNDIEEFINSPEYDTAGEKLFFPEFYADDLNYTTNHAFAISNEMLPESFKNRNLFNKRVLTVGSSGDQALNAIMCGAKDITIIDANIFTQFFIEYKIAAIKTFSFDMFDELFITNDFFDWKVYAKISHLLSPKVKLFYDTLILNQSQDLTRGIFTKKHIKEKMLYVDHRDRHSHFYKNQAEYEKLQNILNTQNLNINYITAELLDFPNVLNQKYDLIYLSNIFDYFKTKERKQAFEITLDKLYTKSLNHDGEMVVNYDFCTKHNPPPQKLGNLEVTSQTFDRFCYGAHLTDTLWVVKKGKSPQDEVCK